MKKIRWGIIGCGDVTEVKSGPGFQKAEGSELIAVMRRDPDLAEDYARRHSVPKWYNNAAELINDDDVDAVYIATPPSSHKQYVLDVALAGKPVYVEKPMALNYKECVSMVEACRLANVPLFTAYYRRALPRFLKIKSLIDDGIIGDVRAVNMVLHQPPGENDIRKIENWRTDPDMAGCGYFCDLGSHMIDLIQFFLSDIVTANGVASNQSGLYKAEDTVSASMIFKSGVHATGNWCFCADKDMDKTEIIGTAGRIVYSNFAANPVILEMNNSTEEFNINHPDHVAQPLIQTIVDELLGKGKCPSTGDSGARTSLIMDKILGRQ
ncbi:MAG: oxidoreductase [Ignavibacteriae bacterium HGW-Ignavibacteriae-3]|nr:MAG: oxidoreductase [Ignavibacteriae bacterium HGW-Ignavibacteriae-3]